MIGYSLNGAQFLRSRIVAKMLNNIADFSPGYSRRERAYYRLDRYGDKPQYNAKVIDVSFIIVACRVYHSISTRRWSIDAQFRFGEAFWMPHYEIGVCRVSIMLSRRQSIMQNFGLHFSVAARRVIFIAEPFQVVSVSDHNSTRGRFRQFR